jgi:pyrrolysine biosynthesis protein PylD
MTRLREEDLCSISWDLQAYDAQLLQKTGLDLKGIAARAAGISEEVFSSRLAAAVPMTGGQGRIRGFAEMVTAILAHLGTPVLHPSATDVTGIAEAIAGGAEVIFFADDQSFVALDLPRKRIVDNAGATARGYVTALGELAGGLEGKSVLVLGAAGKVGRPAIRALAGKGAKVSGYDPEFHCGRASLRTEAPLEIWPDLEDALQKHRIYFVASPAAEIIQACHIDSETIIAAPGMPLGLTAAAARLASARLIHDPLQIGVATMMAEILIF